MPHSLSSFVRKSGGEGILCTVCEIVLLGRVRVMRDDW